MTTQPNNLRRPLPDFWKITPDELEAYKRERADAVMEALRAGKTLSAIGGRGERDFSVKHKQAYHSIPAVWTAESIRAWATRFPEWGAEVARLAEINRKASDVNKGAAHRSRTACKQGHPYTPENIYYENRRFGDKVYRSRACKVCHQATQRKQLPTPEQIQILCEAVTEQGRTLRAAGATLSLSSAKLANFTKTEAGQLLLPASRANYLAALARPDNPRWAGRRREPGRFILAPYIAPRFRNDGNLLALIGAHVPRHLPRDMQDDIIGDVTIRILAGEIPEASIPEAVKEAVRLSFRTDHNKFGPISLDMPRFDDGGGALIERITTGLWQ